MKWKSKEIRTDLYLMLGLVIIVVGFIELEKFPPWSVIISGLIIMQIGVIRFFRELKKGKKNDN